MQLKFEIIQLVRLPLKLFSNIVFQLANASSFFSNFFLLKIHTKLSFINKANIKILATLEID